MCITLKSEVKRNAEMYYLMREPDMKKYIQNQVLLLEMLYLKINALTFQTFVGQGFAPNTLLYTEPKTLQ